MAEAEAVVKEKALSCLVLVKLYSGPPKLTR